jgi:hypothetical protein
MAKYRTPSVLESFMPPSISPATQDVVKPDKYDYWLLVTILLAALSITAGLYYGSTRIVKALHDKSDIDKQLAQNIHEMSIGLNRLILATESKIAKPEDSQEA